MKQIASINIDIIESIKNVSCETLVLWIAINYKTFGILFHMKQNPIETDYIYTLDNVNMFHMKQTRCKTILNSKTVSCETSLFLQCYNKQTRHCVSCETIYENARYLTGNLI